MAIVQVKDATGSVLDWMVAKCEGTPSVRMFENSKGFRAYKNESMKMQGINFAPSTVWAQGGPVIDREIGNLWKHNKLDPNEPDVWTAAAYCKAQTELCCTTKTVPPHLSQPCAATFPPYWVMK